MTSKPYTITQAIKEWKSCNRTRGCISAAKWFCKRVPEFHPVRVTRFTKLGDMYSHVVATDGAIVIDLAPSHDLPRNYDPTVDGDLEPKRIQ